MLAANVNRKNLSAAYCFRGPPQTAMMKYIGTSPTSQNRKKRKKSREMNTPRIVVWMRRDIAKNSRTRWRSSQLITRASVVRRHVRNTRGTESSSTPTEYETEALGNQGADSYARYVNAPPGSRKLRSSTPVAEKNPRRRTMERTRGTKEIASARIRAVSSAFPVRYTRTAPRAGARSMMERIGRSNTA